MAETVTTKRTIKERGKQMTINTPTKALKKLHKTVTGEDPKGNDVAKILSSLADNWVYTPNSVQTISGKANAPFGSVDLSKLASAIANGDASADYIIDASIISAGSITGRLGATSEAFVANGATITSNTATAYATGWNLSGVLQYDYLLNGGSIVDISAYAGSMPTTLTIYWHPMPSSSAGGSEGTES